MAGMLKCRIDKRVFNSSWLSGKFPSYDQVQKRRPLKIYTVDSDLPPRFGGIANIDLVFEDGLEAGPSGRLIVVDTSLGDGSRYRSANLNDADILRMAGYAPDPADSRFHCQSVYAVGMRSHERFTRAVGRMIAWSFGPDSASDSAPITVRPFRLAEPNAYYSRNERAIVLGHFRSAGVAGIYPKDKIVCTSLSTDVLSHEFSHALLDAVRPHFQRPTNPDVPAFHESFADLSALLQRLQFPDLVRAALEAGDGAFDGSPIIQALAPEFARGAGAGIGLRTFKPEGFVGKYYYDIGPAELGYEYGANKGPHEQGRVLTEALLEALVTAVETRIAPIRRLHAAGAWRGAPPTDEFLELLTREIVSAAAQFYDMCVRALDYTPPVDIELPEFLRALITVDRQMSETDTNGLRDIIIAAFRRRSLYPRDVAVMSQTALEWSAPAAHEPINELSFANLRLEGDPFWPPTREETERQAEALARRIDADESFAQSLGVVVRARDGASYNEPAIIDIRPTRRISLRGEAHYDLCAQVVQSRRVRTADGRWFEFIGGSSIFFDWFGRLRFAVRRRVDNQERIEAQSQFLASKPAEQFWESNAGEIVVRSDFAQNLCRRSVVPASDGGP